MSTEQILKAIEGVEAKMKQADDKASEELKNLGKVTADTKTMIDSLGTQQRELADRLTTLEQKGQLRGGEGQEGGKGGDSAGALFVKSAGLDAVRSSLSSGSRFGQFAAEVKNTITNTVGNTGTERQPGIVGGAFRVFTLEQLLNPTPTSATAIEYVRESAFTNAAAETAEGASLPESAVTTSLETMPMATVGHWLKISRQLAADNAALASYINTRMIYGCNLKVENQLIAGNGSAPNLSGFTKSGNFVAHGYTDASLAAAGLSNNRFDLIGKMLGDAAASDFPADAIVLNVSDWWTVRLAKDSHGRYLLGDPGSDVPPSLFGRPVVASSAMTAGKVMVANLTMAAQMWNRESVLVELSDSDGDNFVKNLITIRAQRRCALTVVRPSAVRYGDLVPA